MALDDLSVVIDDDTETIRIDPVTGTVETDQPDGSVVVNLDAKKSRDEDEENEWFRNLADDIVESQLGTLANDLYEQISADDSSRQQKLSDIERGLDLLGIKLDEPRSSPGDSSSGVEGMSTVTNPLLLEAVLTGWANAQAELLPANGPVKIRDDGEETIAEDDLAERFEKDMNHWFTTTNREYYPDTSHMLLWGVYFCGAGFKKIYRCPMKRRPTSLSVSSNDLIVSDASKDFASCSRITHQILMRPSVMKRMMLIGAYRDIGLTQPAPVTNIVDQTIGEIQGVSAQKTRPEDQPYTIWETQCELDLDEFIPAGSVFKAEGIPLPYCVSMDKDSRQILAIRRDWDEDDDDCQRKRMYVKYPYVPGPGFYGTGLLNILGNCTAAMTAAWREALDAGMFASFPGGLIAKHGSRQLTSTFRVAPGQFMAVETGNLPIGQVVMGMPYKDVTPGLMTLMDKITEQAKRVGGAADIPASEGIQNVPVGTMLAAIEQATKIMAAAHKGMHNAAAEELELIIDLFRAHPEDFWRSNKIAPRDYWSRERFEQAVNDVNLVPVSDPNVPSHIHRIAKALALVQLIAIPDFKARLDAGEVLKRCLIAIREDARGLVIDPPPQQMGPPDLKGQADLISAQAKVKDVEVKAQKSAVEASTSEQQNALKQQEFASKERVANLGLQTELVIHAADQRKVEAQERRADQQQFHEQTMETRRQSHEEGVAAHERAKDVSGLMHETQQAVHDRTMDVAGHNLAVHEVMHPPKPAAAKPKAKK